MSLIKKALVQSDNFGDIIQTGVKIRFLHEDPNLTNAYDVVLLSTDPGLLLASSSNSYNEPYTITASTSYASGDVSNTHYHSHSSYETVTIDSNCNSATEYLGYAYASVSLNFDHYHSMTLSFPDINPFYSKQVYLYEVSGDSSTPYLPLGAIFFVDTNANSFTNSSLYTTNNKRLCFAFECENLTGSELPSASFSKTYYMSNDIGRYHSHLTSCDGAAYQLGCNAVSYTPISGNFAYARHDTSHDVNLTINYTYPFVVLKAFKTTKDTGLIPNMILISDNNVYAKFTSTLNIDVNDKVIAINDDSNDFGSNSTSEAYEYSFDDSSLATMSMYSHSHGTSTVYVSGGPSISCNISKDTTSTSESNSLGNHNHPARTSSYSRFGVQKVHLVKYIG